MYINRVRCVVVTFILRRVRSVRSQDCLLYQLRWAPFRKVTIRLVKLSENDRARRVQRSYRHLPAMVVQ